jgi:uncharacterized protein YndB with AHSA1/START domain
MADEKKIERSVEIEAGADAVWRAVSDAEELKKWFPPGVGGAIWLSWGEGSDWESPIEIWQPGKHLRTVDTTPVEGSAPIRVAVDYLIEATGGTTVLRLVHSGFAASTWDEELDTMGAGWMTFVLNLKHYLERHPGEPRTVAYARHQPVDLARTEVYGRTLRAMGVDADSLRIGGSFRARTRNGDEFRGVVKAFTPPINVTATVENWNDGFLMIEIEPGRERCRPAIWLSLYGEAGKQAPAVQKRLRDLLSHEFPIPDKTAGP